jgi:hypothetical protein
MKARLASSQARSRWTRTLWVLLPAAAAVALVSSWALHQDVADRDPTIAAKGSPSLVIVARRSGTVSPVAPGATLAPGDEIRFVVRSSGFRYLLVASIDAGAKASVYFPYGGSASGAIEPAGETQLPGSIVLDATKGPERVFAFFSERPLEAASVTEPLGAIGKLGPDAIRTRERIDVAAVQTSVLIENSGAR